MILEFFWPLDITKSLGYSHIAWTFFQSQLRLRITVGGRRYRRMFYNECIVSLKKWKWSDQKSTNKHIKFLISSLPKNQSSNVKEFHTIVYENQWQVHGRHIRIIIINQIWFLVMWIKLQMIRDLFSINQPISFNLSFSLYWKKENYWKIYLVFNFFYLV